MLAEVKLIAEPWDIGPGGYQVGNFPVGWAEWNGKYRDTLRDYWRGAPLGVAGLAYRLTGSSDLYADDGRSPSASVNFVTAHDGFTLADLVSYQQKRNQANGEDNRDGSDDNRSWNCGVEGESTDPAVVQLRRRQQRNFLASLLHLPGLSDDPLRGRAGPEPARQQQRLLPGQRDLLARLGRRRPRDARLHPPADRAPRPPSGAPPASLLHREGGGARGRKDVRWLRRDGEEMTDPDWGNHGRQSLAMILDGGLIPDRTGTGERIVDDTLAVLLHSSGDACEWELPPGTWEVIVDTALPAESSGARSVRPPERLHVEGRSLVVLRLAEAPPRATRNPAPGTDPAPGPEPQPGARPGH